MMVMVVLPWRLFPTAHHLAQLCFVVVLVVAVAGPARPLPVVLVVVGLHLVDAVLKTLGVQALGTCGWMNPLSPQVLGLWVLHLHLQQQKVLQLQMLVLRGESVHAASVVRPLMVVLSVALEEVHRVLSRALPLPRQWVQETMLPHHLQLLQQQQLQSLSS